MFGAIANVAKSLVAPAAAYVTAKGTKLLGKKTMAAAGAVSTGLVGATMAASRNPTVKLAGAATAGVAAANLLGGQAPRRRRRRRRFPTALQMARYEQAQDLLKGHPGAPAMRKMLAWKFFSRYKWI